MNEQQMLQLQATNVMEVIEDAVESICDEHVISGEKVWTMIGALAVSYTHLTLPTKA